MHHIIVQENNLKKKKNAKKFNTVIGVFEKAGIEYVVHKTNRKGMASEICAEVTAESGNAVIVMGGDGTLHDVLNGFKNFECNYMGLIPLGTGNDFAATAGIPKDAKKAAEIIAANNPRKIDFIELSSGLRSLNAVGMGIDVDVLKKAYSGKNAKKSKYLRSLISCLAKFKSYDFTVRYGGHESRHSGLIAAVGNGRQIGGGIKTFPQADITDGYLDLLIADFISRPKIIGAFIKLMRGKISKIKQVTAVKTKAVEFIPHGENYSIQADGELYDNVAFCAKIAESKLSFYL